MKIVLLCKRKKDTTKHVLECGIDQRMQKHIGKVARMECEEIFGKDTTEASQCKEGKTDKEMQ